MIARRCSRLLLLGPLLLAAIGAEPGAVESNLRPGDRAADSAAAVVTPGNLLASERFWPYRVELLRAWRPEGRDHAIPAGAAGVLVRVETSALARIDFGRDGVHRVPIGETDLVARAERIRRGELEKEAPNFVWAIGPRLLDSSGPALTGVGLRDVAAHRAFLCVFADPRSSAFADLVSALARLPEPEGVATILLPQGERPDAEVFERLRSLGWRVPFVHDHLSEGYTRSLLSDGIAPPALLLQTDEGRMLFEGSFRPGAVSELAAALQAAFPTARASGQGALTSRSSAH